MTKLSLAATIEAILFAAGEPIKHATLVRLTGASPADVEAALAELDRALSGRGLVLLRHKNTSQLVTAAGAEEAVAAYLGTQVRSDLSQPAMETLAIVAYHQPITRSRIEELRGVASEQTLRNLQLRGLIAESGKSETPGRPILYGTTTKFLQHFGLKSPTELPPLGEEL